MNCNNTDRPRTREELLATTDGMQKIIRMLERNGLPFREVSQWMFVPKIRYFDDVIDILENEKVKDINEICEPK